MQVSLVYKNERPLFILSMVIGSLAWLALVAATLGIALVYAAVFFLIYLFAQSSFVSHLKGNAIELGPQQFPDLYAQYRETCSRLGMDDVPTAYLMMSDGVLNALAARFLRRHYVVLYSSVVDALKSRPEALRFYFGHELAHIKQGHLDLHWLRWPAGLLPLLGAGYRRAQEYTCDLHGLAGSNSPADALAALGVLGSGGEKLPQLNAQAFIEQQRQAGGFWMSYHELTSDYPWLCKRLAHVAAQGGLAGTGEQAPPRHRGAWLLAALTPRLGLGGGGLLVFVVMIGLLAAIAIPAYQDYRARTELAGVWPTVEAIQSAAHGYVDEHREYPPSAADVGVPESFEEGSVESIQVHDGGFELVLRSDNPLLNGTTVLVSAYLKDDQSIGWQCTGGTLPEKYRPPPCRSGQ